PGVLEAPDVRLTIPNRCVQDGRSVECRLVVVPGTICDVDKSASEGNEPARETVEIDVGGRDGGRRRGWRGRGRGGRSRTRRNDQEQSGGARCARREPTAAQRRAENRGHFGSSLHFNQNRALL